ncbi:MAG: hypothetical protein AAFX53_09870, partial [Bacteroidota bacterium]
MKTVNILNTKPFMTYKKHFERTGYFPIRRFRALFHIGFLLGFTGHQQHYGNTYEHRGDIQEIP